MYEYLTAKGGYLTAKGGEVGPDKVGRTILHEWRDSIDLSLETPQHST